MKKIFSIALAATLLAAGCQKTEVIGLDDSKTGPAMTFSADMKKITKGTPAVAATDKDYNLQKQGFSIWAFADYDLTNATNVNTSTLVYDNMSDWLVDYNGGWTANKEYYWPGTDKDLRFFAVSATRKESETVEGKTDLKYTVVIDNGMNATPGNTADDTTPSVTVKDFVVSNTSPNEDLMVADFIKQNQGTKQVTLDFHHTLSKVEFRFKTTPDGYDKDNNNNDIPIYNSDVIIKSILVEKLETKGTLVAEGTSATDGEISNYKWYLASVNPYEEEKSVQNTNEFLKSFGKTATTDPLTNISTLYDTWLVLPQDITDKKVKIQYNITNKTTEVSRDFEVIFNLTGNIEGFTSWDINQYVVYTIDISPNKISFETTSTDWTKFDGDGNANTDSDEDGKNNNDDVQMNN